MSTISPPAFEPAPARVADDGTREYDYFWSRGDLDIRIPRWVAEIMEVPAIVRLEIFMFGLCIGLCVAAGAILFGLYLAAT